MASVPRRSVVAAALALVLMVFVIGEIVVDDRRTDPLAPVVLAFDAPSRASDATEGTSPLDARRSAGPTSEVGRSSTRATRPGTSPCSMDTARPAAVYQAALSSRAEGWLRGDLSDVVPLPSGQQLWVFGDTYYGSRSPDGAIAEGWQLTNSSAVLVDGSCFEPVDPLDGFGWIPSLGAQGVYWPHEAVVVGDTLLAFAVDVSHAPERGPEGLDFVTTGGAIATFDLENLSHPATINRNLPHIDGHPFSRGVHVVGDHVVAYASIEGRGTFAARTALVADGVPTFDWEFWDGTGWSGTIGEVAAIHTQRIRVWPDGDDWAAVSLPVLGAEIIEFRGPSPTGPFVETARHGLTPNPWPAVDRWVYEPLIFEPEPGAEVMVFNSLPADTGLVVDNVELYGPQFMDTTRPVRQG